MTDRKAHLISFGCQMNAYDTDRLAALLVADGWSMTDNKEEADLIFYNTCSIREKAAQKIMNHLKQLKSLKKKKPDLMLAVGGCVAEQEGQALLDLIPWLDLVAGPQRLPELPALLKLWEIRPERTLLLGNRDNPAWGRENLTSLKAPLPEETVAKSPLSAFVTIMQGCDNFCAYCVVPYLRGREKSRQPADIINEIALLVKNGAKEITLLGQNVNSYGRNLDGQPRFSQLLDEVAAIDGLWRLRFTTSHPKDFPDELISRFGQLPPLCEQLHLPVQSGSDAVLKAMGRHYDRAGYLKLVEKLKKQCPDLALSTDIIVGFPGETRRDFEETLSILKTVEYDSIFSFNYSDRPQTKAFDFDNKVPEEEKGARLTELQTLQKQITLKKNSAHIGQTLEVLVQGPSGRYEGQLTGHSRGFKIVNFYGPATLAGQLVQVKITEAWGASLLGEMRQV